MEISFELSLKFMIMFKAICIVLKSITSEGATYIQEGDANAAYDAITSFEFVFILHLMIDTLEVNP